MRMPILLRYGNGCWTGNTLWKSAILQVLHEADCAEDVRSLSKHKDKTPRKCAEDITNSCAKRNLHDMGNGKDSFSKRQ